MARQILSLGDAEAEIKSNFENRIGSRKAVASELRQVPGSNPKTGADVW